MSNMEKIAINGHYVWVDKDAEIKEGYYFLYQFGDYPEICQNDGLGDPNQKKNCFKIIAASPELNLEGVPTYIEWLAEQYAINKSLSDVFKQAHKTDFIKGYQTAEKELFTEDDVRRAILQGRIRIDSIEPKYAITEIIEQLKQLKK